MGVEEAQRLLQPMRDIRAKETLTQPANGTRQGYVVGFLFDQNLDTVLVRKNRPEWQAGLLNGVGGKIEPMEFPRTAMVREFKEETGVIFGNWINYAVLRSPRSEIWVYKGFTTSATLYSAKRQEGETENLEFWNVYGTIPEKAVPNLSWLIPAAIVNVGEKIEVTYPGEA